VHERDQRFRIALSNPSNAGVVPDALGFDNPPLVTILDDDPLTLTLSDATVIEGSNGVEKMHAAVFTLTASVPTEPEVLVRWFTADGTATASGAAADYVPALSSDFSIFILQPGQMSATVNISIRGDVAVEPDETFFVDLSSAFYPLSGVPRDGTVPIARARGVGTIIDDDSPVDAAAPVLFDEEGKGRAVALDSVTLMRDPFSLDDPFNFSADRRTRVMLFARNLTLQPGEGASAVTAEAVDTAQNVHALEVEFVGPLPGTDDVTQIVLRLANDLPAFGDVRLRVRAHGLSSNEVFISLQPRPGG
jgi:hypothetical protein